MESCSTDWYLSHLMWGANSELAYFGHLGRAETDRERGRAAVTPKNLQHYRQTQRKQEISNS